MNQKFAMKKNSFSATYIAVALCAVIFVVTTYSVYRFVERYVTTQCDQVADRDVDKVLLYIDGELGKAESALRTFASSVFEDGKVVPEEEVIYRQMEQFLKNNPNLSGVGAGFSDELFPAYAEKNGYGPLVSLKDNEICRFQLGERNDFRHRYDWYAKTFESGKPSWSAPIKSIDDETRLIICYSMPLRNAENQIVGVLACNLRLSRLTEAIQEVKPYPTATVKVVMRDPEDLRFIIHPIEQYLLKETLVTEYRNLGVAEDPAFIKDLGQGGRGKQIRNTGKHQSFVYYAPVERTSFSTLIDCPTDEVYAILSDLNRFIWLAGGIGLLLLVITMGLLTYLKDRNFKKENEMLRQAADTDALTGLPNRKSGQLQIDKLLEARTPGVLVILGANDFKGFNDRYGHVAGDQLLQEIGKRLKEQYGNDLVFRLGGSEFAAYVKGRFTPAMFESDNRRFIYNLNNITLTNAQGYEPNINMGGAIYDGESEVDFRSLVTLADRCLSISKQKDGCSLSLDEYLEK